MAQAGLRFGLPDALAAAGPGARASGAVAAAQAAGDGRGDDDLIPLAASRGAVARVWQAPQGLVVPRSYVARPGFARAQARFQAQGWPITVRLSGGGVVPQGPGILNLSIALPLATERPLDHSEALYRLLCALIQSALASLGIATRAQAVEGSFCDGRFNLATGEPARKVAGTAQVWRRTAAGDTPRHVGMAHALVLADVDGALLTRQANRLEEALQGPRRYRADRIASLASLVPAARRAGFVDALREALTQTLQAPHTGPEARAFIA